MRRLALLSLGLSLLLAAPAAGQELTVWSSLPLQGDAGPISRSVLRAEQLALDQAGGRVGSYTVRLRSLDSATRQAGKWEPGRCDANARRAAADPTTVAYLGEFNSGCSAISMPILNEAGVAQVSPTNTYVGLTRAEGADHGEPQKYRPSGRRTYARVIPADHLQATALVNYLRAERVRRIVVVHDREVYGAGLARMVATRARRAGIRVLSSISLRGSRHARSVARRVRRARAQAMVFGGITQTGGAALFNAVNRVAPRMLLFAGDGVAESPFTRRLRAGARRRARITNPALPMREYPGGAAFSRAYRERHRTAPEPYAIQGFAAMQVVLDALGRAQAALGAAPEARRQAVTEAVLATSGLQTVIGTTTFDEQGDLTLPDYAGNRVTASATLKFDRVLGR